MRVIFSITIPKPMKKCGFLSLSLLCSLASVYAQTAVGEHGHSTLPSFRAFPAPTPIYSVPATITASANSLAKALAAFSLQKPAGLVAQPNGLWRNFPTFALQPPAERAANQQAQEPSERVTSLLNQAYQALAKLDYPTAVASLRQATQIEPNNSKIWLELAFALNHSKLVPEAVEAIQRVIQLEPSHVIARSQLGYLYLQQERLHDAVDTFLAAELLDPTNYSLKLQLGYLFDRLNDKEKARIKFIEASASPDPEIVLKAVKALKALAPIVFARRGIWATEIYAAPIYYRRFNNLIAPFIWRSGIIINQRSGLEGYFSLRATRDTRSTGGQAPQIFEDNFAIASLGLRARPFRNAWTFYGEAGLAINLLPNRLSSVRARSDFRFGTYYSRIWGKRTPREKLMFPFNPIGEIYFDLSYYNRFKHNMIGYLQVREGLRVLQSQESSLEAYGRFNLVKDTRSHFFNNLVETGFGLGFTPHQKWGVKLTAEYMRGFYLGIERPDDPNPYPPRYGDLRFGLIFGKYLVKE
jgi:Flp pilus assembly protein TadD